MFLWKSIYGLEEKTVLWKVCKLKMKREDIPILSEQQISE